MFTEYIPMKEALFILTLFASIGFFNPMQIFSEQTVKLLYYLCVCFSIVVAYINGRDLHGIHYPRKAYWLFMIMIVVSIYPASAYHSQPFLISVMTTVPYILSYAYLLVMLTTALPERFILKWIFIACGLAVPVYFVNLLTFPNVFFGSGDILEDLSRGILRLPVEYIILFVLVLFYAINRILLQDGARGKWYAVISGCMVMIILSVTRQIILYSIILGGLFFFKRVSWAKKLTFITIMLIVGFYVLPMIPAYNTMLELSKDQIESSDEKENVRIGAWRYYTFENQTNDITPIIGNGVPSFGNSVWGSLFDNEIEDNGYLYADVSWAGIIYLFGWIAFAAMLIIILKAIFKRKPPHHEYLTYWFIFILLSGIGAGVFVYPHQILCIMIGLYLIYGTSDEENCDYNTQLQQS